MAFEMFANQSRIISRINTNMKDILEKELSYKVVGILFEVHKKLGGGYQEKYYQKAIASELKIQSINFEEQLHVPLKFKDELIGHYFIDFLIERKLVLEIKSAAKLYPRDVQQVLAYLKSSGNELAILANFARRGLEFKRVLKGYS